MYILCFRISQSLLNTNSIFQMADSSLITRLSDWFSISPPLTTNQLDCVSELREVVKQRPRPTHVPAAPDNKQLTR